MHLTVQLLMLAIADDLNTAKVLAVMHGVLRDTALSSIVKRNTLRYADRVLGILCRKRRKYKQSEIPIEVQHLLEKRTSARINKDYVSADTFRDQINEFGYEVIDTDEASTVVKK